MTWRRMTSLLSAKFQSTINLIQQLSWHPNLEPFIQCRSLDLLTITLLYSVDTLRISMKTKLIWMIFGCLTLTQGNGFRSWVKKMISFCLDLEGCIRWRQLDWMINLFSFLEDMIVKKCLATFMFTIGRLISGFTCLRLQKPGNQVFKHNKSTIEFQKHLKQERAIQWLVSPKAS